MRFIWESGDDRSRELLQRIKFGRGYPLMARFDHRSLPPGTRMALSTISRNGRIKKLFEDNLGKKQCCLVDISVGSGVPRSMRTEEESFLYDESALAAGLVKSLTRQIALSFFSDSRVRCLPGRHQRPGLQAPQLHQGRELSAHRWAADSLLFPA